MNTQIKPSLLHTTLKSACKGTSVTTRELLKELTSEDLVEIKTGEMTVDDLKNVVLDLADNKDNAKLYRINVKDNNADPFAENLF